MRDHLQKSTGKRGLHRAYCKSLLSVVALARLTIARQKYCMTSISTSRYSKTNQVNCALCIEASWCGICPRVFT
jgi:hypothetical protein